MRDCFGRATTHRTRARPRFTWPRSKSPPGEAKFTSGRMAAFGRKPHSLFLPASPAPTPFHEKVGGALPRRRYDGEGCPCRRGATVKPRRLRQFLHLPVCHLRRGSLFLKQSHRPETLTTPCCGH